MVDQFAFDDNSILGWDSVQAWDFIRKPALNLAIALMGSIVAFLLMMKFLPSVPLFNSLVMKKELVTGDGWSIIAHRVITQATSM